MGFPVTVSIPTREYPAPAPLALLRYLGDDADSFTQGSTAEQLLEQHRALEVFLCPDVPAERIAGHAEQAVMPLFGELLGYGQLWTPGSDYAFNGSLLGFHHDRTYDRQRLRGRLAGVKDAATLVLAADADCANYPVPTTAFDPDLFTPGPGTNGDVSLAAALDRNRDTRIGPPINLDRHQGRVVVSFVDGHVETLQADAESLSAAMIRRK